MVKKVSLNLTWMLCKFMSSRGCLPVVVKTVHFVYKEFLTAQKQTIIHTWEKILAVNT